MQHTKNTVTQLSASVFTSLCY